MDVNKHQYKKSKDKDEHHKYKLEILNKSLLSFLICDFSFIVLPLAIALLIKKFIVGDRILDILLSQDTCFITIILYGISITRYIDKDRRNEFQDSQKRCYLSRILIFLLILSVVCLSILFLINVEIIKIEGSKINLLVIQILHILLLLGSIFFLWWVEFKEEKEFYQKFITKYDINKLKCSDYIKTFLKISSDNLYNSRLLIEKGKNKCVYKTNDEISSILVNTHDSDINNLIKTIEDHIKELKSEYDKFKKADGMNL